MGGWQWGLMGEKGLSGEPDLRRVGEATFPEKKVGIITL